MATPHRNVELQERFIKMLHQYGKVETALSVCDLPRTSYDNWRQRYPDFKERCQDALDYHKGDVRGGWVDRVMGNKERGIEPSPDPKAWAALDRPNNALDYSPEYHHVTQHIYISAIPDAPLLDELAPPLEADYRELPEGEDA